jgi:hypothetical protein
MVSGYTEVLPNRETLARGPSADDVPVLKTQFELFKGYYVMVVEEVLEGILQAQQSFLFDWQPKGRPDTTR